jgi:hypothetical protein
MQAGIADRGNLDFAHPLLDDRVQSEEVEKEIGFDPFIKNRNDARRIYRFRSAHVIGGLLIEPKEKRQDIGRQAGEFPP